jgi:hypothetical protein
VEKCKYYPSRRCSNVSCGIFDLVSGSINYCSVHPNPFGFFMVEAFDSSVLDGVVGKRLVFCCCGLLVSSESIGIVPNGLCLCGFSGLLSFGEHTTIRVGAVG